MKTLIRKKTGFVLTLLACCVVGVHAKDVPECLRDLHSLSGVTNYNAETYLENIQQREERRELRSAGRAHRR